MSNKSIHYVTLPATLAPPAAHATTVTTPAFDRERGFNNDIGAPYEAVDFILDVGAFTDGTHTPKLQDSPDGVTWTDVPAANNLGAFTPITSAAQQNALQRVSYVGGVNGPQRYVRCVVTVTGATNGAIYGVLAVAAYPRNLPTVVSGT